MSEEREWVGEVAVGKGTSTLVLVRFYLCILKYVGKETSI